MLHKVKILRNVACNMEVGFNTIVNYNPGYVHNHTCDILLLVVTIGTHIYLWGRHRYRILLNGTCSEEQTAISCTRPRNETA